MPSGFTISSYKFSKTSNSHTVWVRAQMKINSFQFTKTARWKVLHLTESEAVVARVSHGRWKPSGAMEGWALAATWSNWHMCLGSTARNAVTGLRGWGGRKDQAAGDAVFNAWGTETEWLVKGSEDNSILLHVWTALASGSELLCREDCQ